MPALDKIQWKGVLSPTHWNQNSMQKYLSNTPFNVKCTDWYFYLKVALCKKASQLGVCNVCSILISVFWIFQPWPLWQQVSVELGKWDGQYDERWVGGYYKKSLGFTTQSYLQSVSSLLRVWPHLVAVLLCCCHIPGCCCLLLQQKAGCLSLLVTVCTLSARLSTVDWALTVATPLTRQRPADRASRPCHHTRPHTETCSPQPHTCR